MDKIAQDYGKYESKEQLLMLGRHYTLFYSLWMQFVLGETRQVFLTDMIMIRLIMLTYTQYDLIWKENGLSFLENIFNLYMSISKKKIQNPK
jgi:hypothetical protein